MATSSNESNSTGFYVLHNEGRQIAKPTTDNDTGDDDNFAKLLFENERLQVWDFRLPPQKSVSIRHDTPTIRWQVDQGSHCLEVNNNADDKKQEDVADRKVFHVTKGTHWQLTNTGDSVYRQSVFCLKSDTPKYSEEQVRELFLQAIYSTDVGTALLFENELCRVWDFYLAPGEGGGKDTVHHHCLDYVFINVAPSRLLGLHPETLDMDNLLFDSISDDNQVTWNTIPETAGQDKTFAHGGKNGYDDRPMREYLVELK